MATANPRVLDLTGATRRTSFEVVASPVVDFLISLQTFQSPEGKDTYDVGPGWFDEVRMKASADLLATVNRIGLVGWGTVIGYALVQGRVRDVASLLEGIDAMPAADVWTMLAGAHMPMLVDRVGPDAFPRAAAGDPAAREKIAGALQYLFGEEHSTADLHLLEMTPEETKDLVLAVLRGWYREVWAAGEREVSAVLERDAAAKVTQRRAIAGEALVESATNGLVFEQEPWIRRVILSPHLAMRPWNVTCVHDDALIVAYPAADESLNVDRAAPPARLLRLHKALGDEKRLRILKVLTGTSATLQELADAVGLAKSSTHHHMVILRSAGLVKTTLSDDNRYTLRRETIPEASGMLAAFLEGGSS